MKLNNNSIREDFNVCYWLTLDFDSKVIYKKSTELTLLSVKHCVIMSSPFISPSIKLIVHAHKIEFRIKMFIKIVPFDSISRTEPRLYLSSGNINKRPRNRKLLRTILGLATKQEPRSPLLFLLYFTLFFTRR
jgi:hypothetical protein